MSSDPSGARQPDSARVLYQFEFRFTDAEIKRFYARFGSRYLQRFAGQTERSHWNLYWISNLILSLVLAIKAGNALWILLPPPILYLLAQFLSHRKWVAYGTQAIKRSSVQPMGISIGEDWVLTDSPTRRIWMSAKLITDFHRIDQYYVVLFADTSICFPIRVVPEQVRSGFEATLSGMVK